MSIYPHFDINYSMLHFDNKNTFLSTKITIKIRNGIRYFGNRKLVKIHSFMFAVFFCRPCIYISLYYRILICPTHHSIVHLSARRHSYIYYTGVILFFCSVSYFIHFIFQLTIVLQFCRMYTMLLYSTETTIPTENSTFPRIQ